MKLDLDNYRELVLSSGLFDADWYLRQYPDVSRSGLDPLDHYLRYGLLLKRNPSESFDARFYLDFYPDVAASGVFPLVHYLRFGISEGRSPKAVVYTATDFAPPIGSVDGKQVDSVAIVVAVYNALEDVKRCLDSVERCRDNLAVHLYIVNDCSDAETTEWLAAFAGSRVGWVTLIVHEKNKGYTKSVNAGLQASSEDYVITLNSDTIVTRGWLTGLIRCMNSRENIGVVGPLSNAASWQNVPSLYDEFGNFAVNELPAALTPDDMARVVAKQSRRLYPQMSFLNGFCFMIRRSVLSDIGFMDEDNFPVGYGEENDFCIRAQDAGYTLYVADDVYVFHAKSKSFGHEKRKQLSSDGTQRLIEKHGEQKYRSHVLSVKNTRILDEVRELIVSGVDNELASASVVNILKTRILFLLPVKGGGGGAHSVIQEVSEMNRLGVIARVAVNDRDVGAFRALYQDVPGIVEIVVGMTPATVHQLCEHFDVVVATIYHSVGLLEEICARRPAVMPAYYVQDYEPLFFPAGSENWIKARDSYEALEDGLLFAKTDWIRNRVTAEHSTLVKKVRPSIDHSTYFPSSSRGASIVVSAMIRPKTPRRGAERTMELFSRISRSVSVPVQFLIFGSDDSDEFFQRIDKSFAYSNLGILTRSQVADVLSKSHVFVDLSDYQAFGRTGLEAMACGCAVVLPIHGGTDEYALDNVNSLLVNPFDNEECFTRLVRLLNDPSALVEMQNQALITASSYSVCSAAVSELKVIGEALSKFRSVNAERVKDKVAVVCSHQRLDGPPTGSAYVRLLMPLANRLFRKRYHVDVLEHRTLPIPGTANIAVLQRDVIDFSLDELKAWFTDWTKAGGSLVYEIDDDLFDKNGMMLRGKADYDASQLETKLEWLLRSAHSVVVSTETLKEKYSVFNERVFCTPNYLDKTLWRLGLPRMSGKGVVEKDPLGPIKIGYIGTPSHVCDLELVNDAISLLKHKYGKSVEFEVIGVYQKIAAVGCKRIGLPANNSYPNFVEWLHKRVNWDIGIIPLVDDNFNRSKSHLKFLEYSALNLAIVCSSVGAYSDVGRNMENCLSVENTTESWFQALSLLIDDEVLRRRLAEQAHKDTLERYTIEGNIDVLVKPFSAVEAILV